MASTVAENADLPGAVEPARVKAELRLYRADNTPILEARDTSTNKTVVGRRIVELDASGIWTVNNLPGDNVLSPSGLRWGRRLKGPGVDSTLSYASIPNTGGPYDWKVQEVDAPANVAPSGLAAHAADTALHGGGQRIALATIATNFATASTSYVDVPGGAITFTVPNRPWVLNARNPLTIGEANRFANMRIATSAGAVIIEDTLRSATAGQQATNSMRAPIPASTYNPTPGTSVTVKLQVKSEVGTSTITVFVDFLGSPLNVAYIEAATL